MAMESLTSILSDSISSASLSHLLQKAVNYQGDREGGGGAGKLRDFSEVIMTMFQNYRYEVVSPKCTALTQP
jgi:hypothetical protein